MAPNRKAMTVLTRGVQKVANKEHKAKLDQLESAVNVARQVLMEVLAKPELMAQMGRRDLLVQVAKMELMASMARTVLTAKMDKTDWTE